MKIIKFHGNHKPEGTVISTKFFSCFEDIELTKLFNDLIEELKSVNSDYVIGLTEGLPFLADQQLSVRIINTYSMGHDLCLDVMLRKHNKGLSIEFNPSFRTYLVNTRITVFSMLFFFIFICLSLFYVLFSGFSLVVVSEYARLLGYSGPETIIGAFENCFGFLSSQKCVSASVIYEIVFTAPMILIKNLSVPFMLASGIFGLVLKFYHDIIMLNVCRSLKEPTFQEINHFSRAEVKNIKNIVSDFLFHHYGIGMANVVED